MPRRRADGAMPKMPLMRYFVFIGGALLALLFVANACLPALPVAEGSPIDRRSIHHTDSFRQEMAGARCFRYHASHHHARASPCRCRGASAFAPENCRGSAVERARYVRLMPSCALIRTSFGARRQNGNENRWRKIMLGSGSWSPSSRRSSFSAITPGDLIGVRARC